MKIIALLIIFVILVWLISILVVGVSRARTRRRERHEIESPPQWVVRHRQIGRSTIVTVEREDGYGGRLVVDEIPDSDHHWATRFNSALSEAEERASSKSIK